MNAAPTYAQLREQNNLLRAELEVVRRERQLIRDELLGLQTLLQDPVQMPEYRFPNVTCSQCGGEFGPGNHGFSHCENHQYKRRIG